MTEPTMPQRKALARAEMLKSRLKELRDHAVRNRSVSKIGLVRHLVDDELILDQIIDELRRGIEVLDQ